MRRLIITLILFATCTNAFFDFYKNHPLIETNIDVNKNLYKYCSKISKETYINTPNISNILYDTHINVINTNNTLYICFRGTSSFKNWKSNFDLRLKEYKKYDNKFKIHNGYYTQYSSIRHNILPFLVKNNTYNNIIVCGHSLGGALATICCLDICDNIYNRNITCVTFGCPRIGDKKFADLYNSYNINTHRIVISGDPIPKWPINREYTHISSSIYFKNKKIYIKPDKSQFSLKRYFMNILNFDYNLYNHKINNYIDILNY
jgi:hypothetical protein